MTGNNVTPLYLSDVINYQLQSKSTKKLQQVNEAVNRSNKITSYLFLAKMPLYSYLGKEEVAEPWAVSLYKNHPLTGAPKNKHY